MIKKNSSHSSKSRTLKPEEKDFLIAIIGENDPKSIGLESLDSILVQELLDGHMVPFDFCTIHMKEEIVNSVKNGRRFNFTTKMGF